MIAMMALPTSAKEDTRYPSMVDLDQDRLVTMISPALECLPTTTMEDVEDRLLVETEEDLLDTTENHHMKTQTTTVTQDDHLMEEEEEHRLLDPITDTTMIMSLQKRPNPS